MSTYKLAHMHDILKLSYISNLPVNQLRIAHLAIEHDKQSKQLIYNRKLVDGSGESIYGLVVAEFLGLPEEFLNVANEVLLEITGKNKNILETGKSRYNNNLYVDSCAMCFRNKSQVSLHTHHIIEKHTANEKGVVNNTTNLSDGTITSNAIMHKNAKDNLIVLCEQCHFALHSNKQELESLSTANGKIVRLKPDTPPKADTNGLKLTLLTNYLI